MNRHTRAELSYWDRQELEDAIQVIETELERAQDWRQRPEVRALVEALHEAEWQGEEPDGWDMTSAACPWCKNFKRDGHAQDCTYVTALAPFDSPAPPTTLVDSSGRYEVKRD